MERKVCIADKENYGDRRNISEIKWIVIHYTANDGDSDENNGEYFRKAIVNASSHLFVDDNSVTKSVPDEFVAWSVGGAKYNNTNGAKHFGECTNYNSVSVELCDNVKDGVVYPTTNTIANAIQVVSELMSKYGISADHVIRHYDVTGKLCPAYWVDDTKWETEFHSKLPGASTITQEAKPIISKSEDEIASEIVKGIGGWGNGEDRKSKLTSAGYNYASIQKKVNSLLSNTETTSQPTPMPSRKSEDEIADDIFRGIGNWGSGQERKDKLTSAGYNADSVQSKVNAKFGIKNAPTTEPIKTKKSEEEIADEIFKGLGGWGTGQTRKDKLTAAGYNAASVQAKVNAKFR